MARRNQWTSLLAVALLAGCFRSLGEAEGDDGGAPEQQGPSDAGGGLDEAHEGMLHDAAPVYRWRANGPEGEREEGPVEFALQCEDPHGEPASCSFRCALDGARPEACVGSYARDWAGVSELGQAQRHEFCVRAEPLPVAGVVPGQASEVCRAWIATPHGRPFVWVPEPLSELRTELRFVPRCARREPDGGLGTAREDCTFRFSLDGQPYVDAPNGDDYVSVQFRGIAPGQHVLRAEVQGPAELPHVWHVSTVTWTVAPWAEPAIVSEALVVPPLMSREELDDLGLGRLLAPYGEFARACKGSGEAVDYQEQLRTYLSYGFGQPHVTGPGAENRVGTEDAITACVEALRERPAACRSLPGLRRTFFEEGPLVVRLPDTCSNLTRGGTRIGSDNRCLTSLDCQNGVCEYATSWWPDTPQLGYCALSGPEAREGIMCRSRGCIEGLYCEGRACQPVNEPLATCNPAYRGEDCPAQYTCAGGDAPRCVAANARPGDACSFDRDCTAGLCDAGRHVCVE